MKDYEINSSTLAIVPIGKDCSKVYEEEEEYIVNKSSNSIIKDNCIFYGSSYIGRCMGMNISSRWLSKYLMYSSFAKSKRDIFIRSKTI